MYLLGAFVCGGVFGIIALLISKEVPTANHDAMMILIGAITTYAGTVISYFFGSSKGSNEKTTLLANSTPVDNSTNTDTVNINKQ